MRTIKYIALICILLVACKPSLPEGVLSEGTMEDILYDMHIANFIPLDADANDKKAALTDGTIHRSRVLMILKKHDVTEKEWNHSLDYYSRNAEKLAVIYDHLFERMNADALAMGISLDDYSANDDIESLDTTDIWKASKHVVLTSYEPNNIMTWKIEANDSILQRGEKITLNFKSVFVSTVAPQRATALLAVRLDNDSIIQMTTPINSQGRKTLTVDCPSDRKVVELKGMFIMNTTFVEHNTTPDASGGSDLQMSQALFIEGIKLVHQAPTPPPAENTDNQNTGNNAASINDKVEISDSLRNENVTGTR